MQGKYKNKAYPLRIEEATLNAVKSIAAEEGRTANKQIEHILQAYINERVNQEKPTIKYAMATGEPNTREILKSIKKVNVQGRPLKYLKVSKIREDN